MTSAQPSSWGLPTGLGAVLLALCYPQLALADAGPITRKEIIDIAESGVGYGYKWGFAHWNSDGSGKNLRACSTDYTTCTNCCCIKGEDERSACNPEIAQPVDKCQNYYPIGAPGADCSGYVGKSWQLPSRTPPERNSHAFTTKAFLDGAGAWRPIERSDLQSGDALVYWETTKDKNGKSHAHGHIVLFNAFLDTKQGSYDIYEAAGCAYGVQHAHDTLGHKFKAIRRDNVVEADCRTNSCNDHGECKKDVTCRCHAGYAGRACDRCDQGFVGYPSCVRADAMCQLSGTISCDMKPITLSPYQGEQRMDTYGCAVSGLTGGELAFRFDPVRAGKATLRLNGADPGTRLLLLRGACDPAGCVAADSQKLELEFADQEVFYVVVDTTSNANQDVTLSVDCKSPEAPFIGDRCNDVGDCDFKVRGEQGFCYDTGAAGFCSLACTKLCPHLAGLKGTPVCIADPRNPNAGICVPTPDKTNQSCATLPGTNSQKTARFGDTESELACVPLAPPTACTGGFLGRVIDDTQGTPLAQAMIMVEGAAAMTLETDANGRYATANMPCGSYTLRVSKAGYTLVSTQVQVSAGTQTQVTTLSALTQGQCSGEGSVHGVIFDAISQARQPISGANVKVRLPPGQGTGSPLVDITTDAQGTYAVDMLATGNYTVTASKPGYQDSTEVINVCGGRETPQRDIGLVKSKALPMRIVLRWNKPKDLDLHLQTPQANEIYFFTPCRGTLNRAPHAQLDVDRRMAEGPEVISIKQFLPGRYTVFVHNYSADNGDDGTTFPNSGAEVTVYGANDEVLGTFSVPDAGDGMGWDVVSFDGSDPTKLIPLQQLTHRPNPETEYAQDCIP